jgi:hypothetical protein
MANNQKQRKIVRDPMRVVSDIAKLPELLKKG